MAGLILYLLIIATIFLWAMRSPAVAVAGIIAMFSLEQWGQVSHPLLTQFSATTNLAMGGIALVSLFRAYHKKGFALRLSTLALPVILLYGLSFVSILWSPSGDIAMQQWRHHFPYLVTIVLIGPSLVTDRNGFESFTQALYVVAIPLTIALLFFVEWEFRRILIVDGSYETATYGNPLEIGTFSSIVLITCTFFATPLRPRFDLLFRLALSFLSVALIVTSGSRGQLFAALLAISFVLPLSSQRSKSLLLFSPFVLCLMFLLIQPVIGEFGGSNVRWTPERMIDDVLGRYAASIVMLEVWLNSGFAVLVGLGSAASYAQIGTYPHNVAVEVLVEEGVLGFALYLSFGITTLCAGLRGMRLSRLISLERPTIQTLFALCIFCLVISLKQGNLLGNPYYFMFSLILIRMCMKSRLRMLLYSRDVVRRKSEASVVV